MSTKEPTVDDLAGFVEASRPHLRHNYMATAIEGAFFVGAISLVSVESVLPLMVEMMGGASWIIATLPILMLVGFSLPPMFTAHYVERMTYLKPFTLITGIFQRLPYLIAGIALWFWGDSHPTLALTLAVLAPFLSGFFGGLSMNAWATLISRIIPSRSRASATSLRNIMGASIGFGFGYVVDFTLTNYPGTKGFALLHIFAFIVLCASYAVFTLIREEAPPDAEERKQERRSLWQNLGQVHIILSHDKSFARLIFSRMLGTSMFLLIPFMSIYAVQVTGQDASFVGALVSANMLGGLTGNLLSGWLGDAFGGRIVLIISRICFIVMLPIFLIGDTSFAFMACFFLTGMSIFMNMVGIHVLMMDLAPPKRLPTYISIVGLGSLAGTLIVVFSAAQIYEHAESPILVLGISACVLMILSTAILCTVGEPRRKLKKAHAEHT